MDILTTAYLPARGEMQKSVLTDLLSAHFLGYLVFYLFMTFFHRAAYRSLFRTDLQI